MSDEDQVQRLSEAMAEQTKAIREATAAAKDGSARAEEALPALAAKATAIAEEDAAKAATARKAEIDEAVKDAVKAALLNVRSPSLAAQIGNPPIDGPRSLADAFDNVHFDIEPYMKAAIGSQYHAGDFLLGLQLMKGNPEEFATGKAMLDKIGLRFGEAKATLGTTGATGGYVLPNNLVATLEKPNTQVAVYTGSNPLVTVIPGVAVRGIDQPYRTGAPTRMTAQNWGVSKENLDEAYGTYTATLGTFARIYDIGKQYARFSAGSAEQDVLDELTKAAALAENFAVIAGPGTGSATPGVNDPTYGLYTALNGNVYTTAHTASASTVAGSAASGLADAFGALATRSRYPSAAVMDAVSYWKLFSQGSDNAGFWMSNLLGAGFSQDGNGSLRYQGVPIFFDANFDANGASKTCITGEWKALKFYRGLEFRVDTSDVAGNRWDENLIGFRGEVEFGINARTAVAVGAFQLVTGIIP